MLPVSFRNLPFGIMVTFENNTLLKTNTSSSWLSLNNICENGKND